MELTSEKVERIFNNCMPSYLVKDAEYKVGEGFLGRFDFDPEKLKESEQTIISMLSDLPDDFKRSGGGGRSFLNMCVDKNGNQWTGVHDIVDMLVRLGNAIGRVSFLMPREMWPVLPGGMPYIVVED